MIINSRDPQALADLYGFGSFFKSVGRKTASVARGAAHGIQKAGSVGTKVGGWGASIVTAPVRFGAGVSNAVYRNVVGTAVGLPVNFLKAVGQGVIDPFRSKSSGGGAANPNQATIDAATQVQASLPPMQQPAPQSSGGGGGGGGGPTGSDDAPVAKTGELALDPSQPAAPQTFAEKLAALPTAAKLAIAAAAVGGAYVIYKKMKKRGGGSGRRSKR